MEGFESIIWSVLSLMKIGIVCKYREWQKNWDKTSVVGLLPNNPLMFDIFTVESLDPLLVGISFSQPTSPTKRWKRTRRGNYHSVYSETQRQKAYYFGYVSAYIQTLNYKIFSNNSNIYDNHPLGPRVSEWSAPMIFARNSTPCSNNWEASEYLSWPTSVTAKAYIELSASRCSFPYIRSRASRTWDCIYWATKNGVGKAWKGRFECTPYVQFEEISRVAQTRSSERLWRQ